MHEWAETAGVTWALDPEVEAPPLEDILKIPVEGASSKEDSEEDKKGEFKRSKDSKEFDFLLRKNKKERF